MAERVDVTFPSAGAACSAWWYPGSPAGRGPVVVMAHGLGAVRDMRLDAYAERFQQAGYACLVFDYRHFGASGGEPRQLLDVRRQLEDWASAVAYARAREDVDPERVVLWGTSFGGGHVVAAAAADGRIAAVVSQCPFTDGPASVLALDPRTSAKVTALALRDVAGARLRRRPTMVKLAGPPASAALMTAPDAEPGYFALVPDGTPFRDEVAARVVFQILTYVPGRRARRVRCPILWCICEADSVAPAGATKRHARRAPQGEIRVYPEGHFDIYVGEPFERVVADQLAFLRRHVPAAAA